MAWRELLSNLDTNVRFDPPANEQQLAAAQAELGIGLPPALRELLLETDGVTGEYSLPLVWPLDRIVRDNTQFRSDAAFKTLYMPFDPLLFFSDAGNGDQFFFPIVGGEIRRHDVFVWDHESDSRSWVSGHLRSFLADWLTGKLKV